MPRTQRIIELDLLRTIAIVLMVVYHTAFDLWWFYGWNLHVMTGPWRTLASSTALLFLLIVGATFYVANRHRTPAQVWRHAWQRSCVILGCGLLITIATYFFNSTLYIRFGILHCIGISVLLLPIFYRLKEWNALLGLLIVYTGNYTEALTGNWLLLPLGMQPPNFQTWDYYPLVPWFGFVLLGLAVSHVVFTRWGYQGYLHHEAWEIITFPGRHALLTYVAHQPILLGLMWLTL